MPSEEYEDDDLLNTEIKAHEEESEEEENEEGEEGDEEIHFFHILYMCDDCNYRWKAKRKASLSDENMTGADRWFVDDSSMNCPMCGSSNITRA